MYEDNRGNISNGTGNYLFAGATDSGEIRRALIAFEITDDDIPKGSTIHSAVLTLQMTRTKSGRHDISLHTVLADWGEGDSVASKRNEGSGGRASPGDATWIFRLFDRAEWEIFGGDFSERASASTTITGGGEYTWGPTPEMISDIQNWLDDPSTNFGWLIKGNEDRKQTTKRFNSRDNEDESTQPILTIEFELPARLR